MIYKLQVEMGCRNRTLSSEEEESISIGDALLFTTMCIIGLPVDVHIKDGSIYTGIFHTVCVEDDYGRFYSYYYLHAFLNFFLLIFLNSFRLCLLHSIYYVLYFNLMKLYTLVIKLDHLICILPQY